MDPRKQAQLIVLMSVNANSARNCESYSGVHERGAFEIHVKRVQKTSTTTDKVSRKDKRIIIIIVEYCCSNR